MSTLSDLVGGGGSVLEAVASGALANGDLVAINVDGTVSVIAETTIPDSAGTPEVFASSNTENTSAIFDANSNKVVIAYKDNGNTGAMTLIVGTVSGTSISFGTAVAVSGSLYANFISATYDSLNNKIVVAYSDGGNSSYGTSIVGTVSGTSISLGTPVVFESAWSDSISATYDSLNNKIVIAYMDRGNSRYGTAIVGTVSGTSISFGTPVVFESARSEDISATYDSTNNKVVISYRDGDNSSYGTSIVGTVSGTSISFGSPVVFASAISFVYSSTYDSNSNKVVIAYQNGDNSNYGTAIVGTVSGTSISFGTPVVFNSSRANYIATTFDTNVNKVVIAYQRWPSPYSGTVIVGTVSGTSISFGDDLVFEATNSGFISATFDSVSNKVVIAYQDYANSIYGTSVVFTPETLVANLTTENYIGVSDGAYSDAATANVQITGSVNNAQSGLTAGQAYYVQLDGTLATTPDTTPVFAGTALSATELLIGKSPAVNGALIQKVGTVTGNATLDLNTGNFFEVTPTDNLTFAFSNPPAIGKAQTFNVTLTGADVGASYDIVNASYDGVSFSVSSQEATPSHMAFNNDGTKMYVVGRAGDSVYQYSLSTAFDLSTASYDSVSLSVASQETNPTGLEFNNDGTKMYITGSSSDSVNQYTLSTAFDLSTASYASVSFSFATQETAPTDIAFNTDGTKMYMIGYVTDSMHQYSLSTAYDVSTASYDSVSFSVGSQEAFPYSITFNNDGTKVYIVGEGSNTVYEYSLSTAFDVSTASYNSISFSLTPRTSATGLVFNNDGTKMYLVAFGGTAGIYQYTTGTALAPATITYPTSVKFPNGTSPAAPADGEIDSLTFYTDDGGSTFYGFQLGNDMS